MKENTMRLAMMAVLAMGAVGLVLAAGCKKENQGADPNAPQGAYPQNTGAYPQNTGAYPQNTYPQGGYTAPPTQTYPQPAATPPPAGGLPCQTDNDPQCPFGHCVNGACGACSVAEHCKPGAACMQTPLGGKCFPGGAPTQ